MPNVGANTPSGVCDASAARGLVFMLSAIASRSFLLYELRSVPLGMCW